MILGFSPFLYCVMKHFWAWKCSAKWKCPKSTTKGVTVSHTENTAPALPETAGLESSLYFSNICGSLCNRCYIKKFINLFSSINNAVNEQRRNVNWINSWRDHPLPSKTASILLGTPQILLSLHEIQDRLDDVEICGDHIITSRTCCFLHWREFLMTLVVWVGSVSCCRPASLMVLHDGSVSACIYTVNPDQISNSICRNAAQNFQGTSTMLHCCLQTPIIVLLSSPSVNKLPSATARYFTFWLIHPEHVLPFFCAPVPMFSCISKLLGLASMSEVWLFGCNYSMKTTPGQTSPDSRWVCLGPTGFCQFWAVGMVGNLLISKGNKPNVFFICRTKFPLPTTESMILNVAHFFVLSSKEL